MQKSYKGKSFFTELKYGVCDCLKQNKIKPIVYSLLLIVSFVLGVIIAIKYYDVATIQLSQYGLVDFSGGIVGSSFFSRFFSMALLCLLMLACSFTIFTMPIAVLILCYRTYLLGLNLTLLFILYGVPGIVLSLLITLPCQLAIIAAVVLYYILISNGPACKNSIGSVSKLKLTAIILVVLFLINILETILLAIFHAQVILVL